MRWKRNSRSTLRKTVNKEKAAVEKKKERSSSIVDDLALLAWRMGGWIEVKSWRGGGGGKKAMVEGWKDEESERRKGSHHNTWQH